tara:strand:+ start:850 stop:1956 length:1107 start_codon:yes stop_codon:yes gene_type:complete
MKILHLSHAMVWGGNEQQLIDLIPELENLGITNTVFCFKKSAMYQYCLKNNIRHISITKKSTYSINLAFKLNKIVEDNSIDIIHMHTSNSVGTFLLFQIIFNKKIGSVFSKKGISDSSSSFSKIKYNFKKIDQFICVSKAVQENFSKILSSQNKLKLNLVYDGINLNRLNSNSSYNIRKELKLDDNVFIIGSIANHSKAKDLNTLIKAIYELTNNLKEKNIFCFQIGKHSDLTFNYHSLIKKLNINKYIKLVGHKKNASSYLSQFNCLCFSSVREGLPLSILEGFHAKIPIISTKAGGIPEVIFDGENGSLVDVHDYKMLAEKIKKLVYSNELRKKFIINGKKTLENKFTNKICAMNTLSVYKKTIEN